MQDIRTTVRRVVLEECFRDQPANALRDDEPLLTSGIMDSLATLKLVSVLEDELNVSVSAQEVDEENFGSVDAIVAFAQRRAR